MPSMSDACSELIRTQLPSSSLWPRTGIDEQDLKANPFLKRLSGWAGGVYGVNPVFLFKQMCIFKGAGFTKRGIGEERHDEREGRPGRACFERALGA